MSFPLFGQLLTFRQPDGSSLQVKAWGDQQSALFETADGLPVLRDPASGFFHIAQLNARGDELRPTALRADAVVPLIENMAMVRSSPLPSEAVRLLRPNATGLPKSRWRERRDRQQAVERAHSLVPGLAAAPPSRVTVGQFRGLCILVDFEDEPASIDRSVVDDFCNKNGFDGFGNNGSVFDYFFDNSGGRLSYRTQVLPYYRARHPKSFYCDPDQPYGERTRDLIVEALTHHREAGVDFTSLTADAEDAVFATNVFYAGNVVNEWGAGLWPHASRLITGFELAAGRFAVDYQISGMSSELKLGTYCHENGHMLCDFPDLYQYSDQRRGIGNFCLMCGGGNADPRNPVEICAYLKFRAGWLDVSQLKAGQSHDLGDGNRALVHSNNSSEYFIIENRQRRQRDAALPDEGLAVWHVDELGSNAEPEKAPPGHQHHECRLLQADGDDALDAGLSMGDARDLFGDTAGDIFPAQGPSAARWWSGQSSGLQIRDVSFVSGNAKFQT